MRATHFRRPFDHTMRLFCCTTALFVGGVLSAASVFADPPARIGRIGYLQGDVSFYADRAEGWQPARLNFPVTGKNSIWTNGAGRAEVRIGATALRIERDTVLDFAVVDDNATQLFLQRGTVNVRLRSSPAGLEPGETGGDTFRVETNQGPVLLRADGRYRIDVSPDGAETNVMVFTGSARYDRRGAMLDVENGKSLTVRVANDAASYLFGAASESPLDRWAEARDSRWDETHQRYSRERQVSPHMTGYEDLDTFGNWVEDGEYGRLWTPRVVVAGWAPYRYGSWAHVQPWGWTWIDEAPWGFAPFHYGRWVQRHTRWYWWPGVYRHRPVYAPALVGWHGHGNLNISISTGRGAIGWFPLAPREHYIPQYTGNTTYIRNINNITNNVTVINRPARFANQERGSTVVGNNVMVNGEAVWRTARIDTGHGRMTKPAIDTTQTTATLTPPGAPVINQPVRNKPAMVPAPFPVENGGERPRRSVLPDTPGGARNTGLSSTLDSDRQTALPGEAPQPRHANLKPAQLVPAPAQQQETNTPPPFVRPVKPRPVAAPPAPAGPPNGAAVAPGESVAPADRQRSARPQRPNEQYVEGPVRTKERGEHGTRQGQTPSESPGAKEHRTKQPVAEGTQRQPAGGKDAPLAGTGESNVKHLRQ